MITRGPRGSVPHEDEQALYAMGATQSRSQWAKAMLDPKIADLCKRARSISQGGTIQDHHWSVDHPLVKAAGRALIKAGVTSALGFNFFDLRGPAYFIFPLNTPLIQEIGKQGKVNAGVGVAAHWKATRNPNSNYVYSGVLEGQRNAQGTPDEIDYLATYKELGQEGALTFTGQYAGEGYTDNMADEHFRNLARLRLGEEMMTLSGNSGTASGNLGYALGTPPNVTAVVKAGSGFGNGTNVVVAVVAITPQGMNPGGQAGYAAPPSVLGGLTTSYVRTNADGSTTNVACGVSKISNVATVTNINAASGQVTVSIPAQKGAAGYAWFWGVNVAAAAANVNLGAITAWPTYTINAAATSSQTGSAAGLSTDNSFQPTDFDGLLTYAFKYGLWNDMNGGSFTPQGNGQIAEIENDLETLWALYQAVPDNIWVSADVRQAFEYAAIYSSTGTNSYVFTTPKEMQDTGLTAGFVVSGYKSKYSLAPNGGSVIPVRIHPMLPQGTLFYDFNSLPPGYQHARIPGMRTFLTQRDYYSIEWPVTTRQWTFGTYIHEVLAHYMPWVSALRTGIGPFVAPCWIAAAVFDEDFFTGPRVNLVRSYLLGWERRSGLGKVVVGAYRLVGERVAEQVKRHNLLKRGFRKLFDIALRKATA